MVDITEQVPACPVVEAILSAGTRCVIYGVRAPVVPDLGSGTTFFLRVVLRCRQ